METREIRGIPTRIWKHAPNDLRVVLDLSRAHGEKDFLVYEGTRLTFEQHYAEAATLATVFQDRFGIVKGERVALAMRNLPAWVVSFWGAAALGAVVVPLNAWWTGEELQFALQDSGASLLVVDRERLGRLRGSFASLPDLRAVLVVDEEPLADLPTALPASRVPLVFLNDVLAPQSVSLPASSLDKTPGAYVLPAVPLDPEDPATIFYTSGTTGRPKGVLGTQRNVCTNLMNLFFISTAGTLRGTGGPTDLSATEQPSILLSVPLFHVTGCYAVMIANAAAGGKLVMMHHWDPEQALELIERERVTTFGGVPTTVLEVLESPGFAQHDTSSIRALAFGGAPAPPDLVRRIKERFPLAAPSNGYGLTETSAITTMNAGDDYVATPDSVGVPVPVCDLRIVPTPEGDTSDLAPGGALPGTLGELWIRGPHVVPGYWNRPEETAAAFSEGWLHTGDIGYLDDTGALHIVDRAKDVVIRGGENIYCAEVEAALFSHRAIAHCAVIGVPHPTLGEEVGAVIIVHRGKRVSADQLTRHARERIPAYCVPVHFWFRSEPLPRNPQGKVLKDQLRSELLADRPTNPETTMAGP
jgi:long-chain acyl-CoA synthetase